MGAGGDHEIRRREAVVTDRRQLALGVESDTLDRAVDREARQLFEATHQLTVILRRSRRVAGLEQEGQADREALLVEPLANGLTPLLGYDPAQQTRPGGVIEEQPPTRRS